MDDIHVLGSPPPPWFAEKLRQVRLQAPDPSPLVVLFARTAREHLAEWLGAHLPGEIPLDDESRMHLRLKKTQEENAYPDLVIGGYTILLESGKWATTYKADSFQPILVFRAAPCSADRCEISIRCTPDPRVRPLVVSLLHDFARAWPETAEVLAPFTSAGAPPRAAPTPPLLPRVPRKPIALNRWQRAWDAMQEMVAEGMSALAISEELRRKHPHLDYSDKTVAQIVAAGTAGLLGDAATRPRSRSFRKSP